MGFQQGLYVWRNQDTGWLVNLLSNRSPIAMSSKTKTTPSSSVSVTYLFNRLLQPVDHDLGDLVIIFFQHHHVAVAADADIFEFDEVDGDAGLS